MTDDTTPKDPFVPGEDDVDIRIIDGREMPLALTIDNEGRPSLFTSLSPIVAADVLINVASGILTGAVVPENFPTGDQLREMLIDKCHERGFSDEAIEEVLAYSQSEEFTPGNLGEFFQETERRDAERKGA